MLRNASAARMLVATFAISYLLQSIALVRFGAIGRILVVIPQLTQVFTVGGLHVRWITVVTILVAAGVFAALTLFLTRTSIGLQMRAASIDSQTARLLGIRANAVITLGAAKPWAPDSIACPAVVLRQAPPAEQPARRVRRTRATDMVGRFPVV